MYSINSSSDTSKHQEVLNNFQSEAAGSMPEQNEIPKINISSVPRTAAGNNSDSLSPSETLSRRKSPKPKLFDAFVRATSYHGAMNYTHTNPDNENRSTRPLGGLGNATVRNQGTAVGQSNDANSPPDFPTMSRSEKGKSIGGSFTAAFKTLSRRYKNPTGIASQYVSNSEENLRNFGRQQSSVPDSSESLTPSEIVPPSEFEPPNTTESNESPRKSFGASSGSTQGSFRSMGRKGFFFLFRQDSSDQPTLTPLTGESHAQPSATQDTIRVPTLGRRRIKSNDTNVQTLGRRPKLARSKSGESPNIDPEETSDTDSINESLEGVNKAFFDNDDTDIDVLSLYSPSGAYAARFIQVRLADSGKSLAIITNADCDEAIRGILTERGEVDINAEDFSIDNYRLCKLGQNVPGTRLYFEKGVPLWNYKLKDGDTIRLIDTREAQFVNICVPPNSQCSGFSCEHGLLVSDVVERLQVHANVPVGEKYGLYYPHNGVWLVGSKPLSFYDIPADHKIELRALSQEFAVRVEIPEFAAKFILKVLPTFTVSTFLSMIRNQMSTRRLVSEGAKHTVFNLSVTKTGVWMQDSELLSKYFSEEAQAAVPDVQYKVQYGIIAIAPRDSPPIRLMCTENATVRHLRLALFLDRPELDQDPNGLFSISGEQYKDTESAWKIIKDMGTNQDVVELRISPQKIQICTSIDEDVLVDMELDCSLQLKDVMARICRRLGLRLAEVNAVGKIQNGTFREMAYEKSLSESCVSEGTTIKLQVDSRMAPFPPESIWYEDPNVPDVVYSKQTPQEPTDEATNFGILGNEGISNMLGATVGGLVKKMTDQRGAGSTDYLDFVKTLLLTYQSFTNARILLHLLIERYHVPRNRDITFAQYDRLRLTVQLRVCNVMLQWTKKYGSDFTSGPIGRQVLEELVEFAEDILAQDHCLMAKQVRKNAIKLRTGQIDRILVEHTIPPPLPKLPKRNQVGVLNLLQYDAEEIARQMTIIEYDLFSRIAPFELLDQAWMRKGTLDAPNIAQITAHFNRISFWTARSVLEARTVRGRSNRVRKLIKIAKYLYTLNNFSTLLSIVAGLNKAAVTRLKHTLKEIDAKSIKVLNEMESLMNAEGSYKKYRVKLHSLNPPCVPYIGVYLLDLIYIEDGNPNTIEGMVNFGKRRLVSKVIREIQQYQDVPYNLCPVEEISLQLCNLPTPTEALEKQLYETSMKREPRGSESRGGS